jgi:hypothetical protein
MSSGSTVLDPELINAQNFDFAKPKLFFKNIGKYPATSTYIHVQIPFNFTTVFNTKQAIAGVYDQLLAQQSPMSASPSLKDHWKNSATSSKLCRKKQRSHRLDAQNVLSP